MTSVLDVPGGEGTGAKRRNRPKHVEHRVHRVSPNGTTGQANACTTSRRSGPPTGRRTSRETSGETARRTSRGTLGVSGPWTSRERPRETFAASGRWTFRRTLGVSARWTFRRMLGESGRWTFRARPRATSGGPPGETGRRIPRGTRTRRRTFPGTCRVTSPGTFRATSPGTFRVTCPGVSPGTRAWAAVRRTSPVTSPRTLRRSGGPAARAVVGVPPGRIGSGPSGRAAGVVAGWG